jgi:hypothetical protein
MKHTHLTLNTVVTVISLLIICVLLYTVTVKQDTKRDEDYKKLCTAISETQQLVLIQQANLQSLERKLWNILNMIPEPTPGTLIIKQMEVVK